MGRGKSTKQFSSVFLLLLLGVELSSAWFWPFSSADPEEFKHESVKALTKDNFEDYVIREDGKYYFVKFYANWCGHCKTLAPKWGQVAAENNNTNYEFLQVECSSNDKLCRKAAVKGFPEIKVFYNGRIGYQATGGMDLEELQNLIKEIPQKVQDGIRRAKESSSKGEGKPGAKSSADEL